MSALDVVRIGWEVWSTTRGTAGVDDNGDQIEPLGGIVLAVSEDFDIDSADVARRFLTLHPGGGRQMVIRWLEAAEVNLETITPPQASSIWRAIRRLAAALAERRGEGSDEEIQRIANMHHLAGTVAQERSTRRPGAPPRLERNLGPTAPPGWYVD